MPIDFDSSSETVSEKLERAQELLSEVAAVMDNNFAHKGGDLFEFFRDHLEHISNDVGITAKAIEGEL